MSTPEKSRASDSDPAAAGPPHHRNAGILHERDELLELAEEAGGLGLFEWQVRDGAVRLSAKFLSLYGLTGFDGN